MKFRTAVIPFAIVGVLVVTGCAASGDAAPEDVSSETGTGGTLSVGLTLDSVSESLDTSFAFQAGGQGMRWIGYSMYEGLTAWDLTDPDAIPPVVGGLAESWEVNDDATEYTFTLRPDVAFSDGTPWDAEAAVFNLRRYTDPEFEFYDEEISAAAGFYIGGIGEVSAVDDMTISVKTADGAPYSFLVQDLTLLPMGSPTAIEADPEGFGDNPVGTGPFVLDSYSPGQSIVFSRNDEYWKGPVALDTLELRFLPDNTARVAALRAGEVNLIESVPGDDITGLESSGYTISANAYSNVWRCVLDTTRAPFDDVRVRNAVNMAVDRQTLVDTVLAGTASPAYQAASAADSGYLPELEEQFAFDVDEAKGLVDDAGASGLDVTFSYVPSGSGATDPSKILPVIQDNLSDIGLNVVPVPMELTALNADQQSGKMPGDAQAACWSGTQVLPSLWSVLTSDSSLNQGKYASTVVDDAFEAAKSSTSLEEQTAQLETLNRQATEDSAWLYISTDINPRGLAPDVHDFINPKSWFLDLSTVWVG